MEKHPIVQAQLKGMVAGDPEPAPVPLTALLFKAGASVPRTRAWVTIPTQILDELEEMGRIKRTGECYKRTGLSEELARALVYYLVMLKGSGDRPGLPALMVRFRDGEKGV